MLPSLRMVQSRFLWFHCTVGLGFMFPSPSHLTGQKVVRLIRDPFVDLLRPIFGIFIPKVPHDTWCRTLQDTVHCKTLEQVSEHQPVNTMHSGGSSFTSWFFFQDTICKDSNVRLLYIDNLLSFNADTISLVSLTPGMTETRSTCRTVASLTRRSTSWACAQSLSWRPKTEFDALQMRLHPREGSEYVCVCVNKLYIIYKLFRVDQYPNVKSTPACAR